MGDRNGNGGGDGSVDGSGVGDSGGDCSIGGDGTGCGSVFMCNYLVWVVVSSRDDHIFKWSSFYKLFWSKQPLEGETNTIHTSGTNDNERIK